MNDFLIKVTPEADRYVVWSLQQDWPTSWGTRDSLTTLAAVADFERADESGIAEIGNDRPVPWGGWTDDQGIQLGDAAIHREDLGTFLDRLDENPNDPDYTDLMMSVDDESDDDYDAD